MVSSRKNLSEELAGRQGTRLLRISEVARRVGISSSALRAWEALGLVTPQRTQSRYRLYAESDVRLLQRAIFLRRARGLNPPAIVHVLKHQGVVSRPAEGTLDPGQRCPRDSNGCHFARSTATARLRKRHNAALKSVRIPRHVPREDIPP